MLQTELPSTDRARSAPAAEQRLILHNVSWDTYEKILEAFGEHRAAHITYDEGILEFMVPLEAHENPSDIIGDFVKAVTSESGFNIKSMASTTLRRQDLLKGAEPDRCYYIQNEALVRGRTVDLEKDPPPDLVIEVDITHTDMDKNRLYAVMGVPELWRYDGKTLRIFQLTQSQYEEVEISSTFPWVPKPIFYRYLVQCKQDGEIPALNDLRVWLQTHKPS